MNLRTEQRQKERFLLIVFFGSNLSKEHTFLHTGHRQGKQRNACKKDMVGAGKEHARSCCAISRLHGTSGSFDWTSSSKNG